MLKLLGKLFVWIGASLCILTFAAAAYAVVLVLLGDEETGFGVLALTFYFSFLSIPAGVFLLVVGVFILVATKRLAPPSPPPHEYS